MVVGLVKLEARLVTGLYVRLAMVVLERDFAKLPVARSNAVNGLTCQPVEPWLNLDAFGFFQLVTQGSGDGFGDYLIRRDPARRQLAEVLPVGDATLNEALETRQVDVDVTGDVNGGDGLGPYHSNGVLEGRYLGVAMIDVAATNPFVLTSQDLLVVLQLLGKRVEGCLDGSSRDGSLLLRGHLS